MDNNLLRTLSSSSSSITMGSSNNNLIAWAKEETTTPTTVCNTNTPREITSGGSVEALWIKMEIETTTKGATIDSYVNIL